MRMKKAYNVKLYTSFLVSNKKSRDDFFQEVAKEGDSNWFTGLGNAISKAKGS